MGSFVTLFLRMTGLGCHSERSEESCRRAVGNGPYKAGTYVSPRRGGNLPPAVWGITDPAAIVGSFVTSFLRMTAKDRCGSPSPKDGLYPAAAELCPGTLDFNASVKPQCRFLRWEGPRRGRAGAVFFRVFLTRNTQENPRMAFPTRQVRS